MNAGSFTGIGFSYRYWPLKAGLQVSFTLYKNEKNEHTPSEKTYFIPLSFDEFPTGTFISAALSGFMQIKKYEHIIMYTYLGNHFLIINDKQYYNLGGGIGFSFLTTLSFNLNIGYGAYDILRSYNLLPAIEMGLHYRIKSNK
jgi:hypothetical protein